MFFPDVPEASGVGASDRQALTARARAISPISKGDDLFILIRATLLLYPQISRIQSV
jgi:hypothetical protein